METREVKNIAIILIALTGCAAEFEPTGDEPQAGSVAVLAQAVTTTSLTNVLTHFGIPSVSYQTLVTGKAAPYTIYHQLVLPKTLYVRVGEDSYNPVKHPFWLGNVTTNVALDQFCLSISGHKVYTLVNGVYSQGLDLSTKLVVR